jgi:hypothetical protein
MPQLDADVQKLAGTPAVACRQSTEVPDFGLPWFFIRRVEVRHGAISVSYYNPGLPRRSSKSGFRSTPKDGSYLSPAGV